MYNMHPYFPLKNVGKKVHIIHGKIWYLPHEFGGELSKIIQVKVLPEEDEE